MLRIISSGRKASVVLQFRVPQDDPLKFLRTSGLFTTAIKTIIIHTHTQTHVRELVFPPSPFPLFVYFSSRAVDERSRWFVLVMAAAPLSPPSDHLHLVLASVVELRARWTATHASRWQSAKDATFEMKFQLKLIPN